MLRSVVIGLVRVSKSGEFEQFALLLGLYMLLFLLLLTLFTYAKHLNSKLCSQ